MSQPGLRSPLATAASNLVSIGVLLGLSVATFAYARTLQPLYGAAATALHLNKIVWAACILGMFTPTPRFAVCMAAAGALLCAMPQTAYWAAAYTGRMGDPVWGPVGTHAGVLLPVLYFGVAMVKELQVRGVHAPVTARRLTIRMSAEG